MKKQIYLWAIVVCIVSMLSFPASAPPTIVSAQEPSESKVYVPVVSVRDPILFDAFTNANDPVWTLMFLKDPKDGFFEYINGKYAAHIQDNSAMMVSSPGWRPRGDFKLEVDGRHLDPRKKSFNGLGLAFSGDDAWQGYYALMLAAGAAQHFWAVVRFEDTRAKYLTNGGYRGGTNFMKNYTGTNRLMVTRIGDTITAYCNGKALPGGVAVDNRYGPGRLVGLVVTSYEFSYGEIDFDNFQLTPLYEGNLGEYLSEQATDEAYEFDTPALDLH